MPGCHGTDQWTLDPPGQPRDRIIPELNPRANCPGFPRGGVLGVEVGGGLRRRSVCGLGRRGQPREARQTRTPGKDSRGDGGGCRAGQSFLKWERSHWVVGGASGNGRALRGRGWPSVLKPPGACWLRHGSEARLPAALGGTTCCRSRNTAAGRCAARREPRDCAGMGSSRGCAAARASRRLQQHARGVPQSEELGTGAQPASAAPVCVAGAAGAPRAGARGGGQVGRSRAGTSARPAGYRVRKCQAESLRHGLKLGRQGRRPFPACCRTS